MDSYTVVLSEPKALIWFFLFAQTPIRYYPSIHLWQALLTKATLFQNLSLSTAAPTHLLVAPLPAADFNHHILWSLATRFGWLVMILFAFGPLRYFHNLFMVHCLPYWLVLLGMLLSYLAGRLCIRLTFAFDFLLEFVRFVEWRWISVLQSDLVKEHRWCCHSFVILTSFQKVYQKWRKRCCSWWLLFHLEFTLEMDHALSSAASQHSRN